MLLLQLIMKRLNNDYFWKTNSQKIHKKCCNHWLNCSFYCINIGHFNMKQLEQQQNFQGEVTSGFIMRLEKQTQENIRLGKQPINNKGENHEKENDKKDYKKIIKIS